MGKPETFDRIGSVRLFDPGSDQIEGLRSLIHDTYEGDEPVDHAVVPHHFHRDTRLSELFRICLTLVPERVELGRDHDCRGEVAVVLCQKRRYRRVRPVFRPGQVV